MVDKNVVELCDVTLRDGLQMESSLVPLDDKLELFRLLSKCGYRRLEITSFVNPKWVPQFSDAAEFAAKAAKEAGEMETMAFVPNVKGLDRLLPHPIPWVSAFIATSESFNKKNVNATREETLVELKTLTARAKQEKRRVRLYVSTVWGCPYEGEIPKKGLFELLKKVADLEPDEIALGDTIGVAVPDGVIDVLTGLSKVFPVERTALHFHNTYGLGLACARAGYRLGVRKFDGSTGGVGGCPYAKGATGNLATDELAYLFFREGSLKQFDVKAFQKVFEKLAGLGLKINSHLSEILAKGATLYGVE